MEQVGAETTNAGAHGEPVLKTTPSSDSSSGGRRTEAEAEAEASDEVHISFLVPSNERYTRVFKTADTAQHAKQTLLDEWPSQFGAKPAALADLKLLYGGNFLDNSASLDVVKRYPDGPTVVHLMISRGKASEKEEAKDTDKASRCTCIIL